MACCHGSTVRGNERVRPAIKIMILIENNNDAVRTTTGKSYDYKITLKIMMVNSFLFSFIICLSYKKTYNHAKKKKRLWMCH